MLHDKVGRIHPPMTGETGHILNTSKVSSEAAGFRSLRRSEALVLAETSVRLRIQRLKQRASSLKFVYKKHADPSHISSMTHPISQSPPLARPEEHERSRTVQYNSLHHKVRGLHSRVNGTRLTRRREVANREIRRHSRSRVGQTIWAILRRTAHSSRTCPHNLAEMTPGSKVAGIGAVNAVGLRIRIDLAIVHGISDHKRYLIRGVACADVLAVSAAASRAVKPCQSGGITRDTRKGQMGLTCCERRRNWLRSRRRCWPFGLTK